MEHEFLDSFAKAMAVYKKGLDMAEAHLGEDHGITETLRGSLDEAQKHVEEQKQKRGHQKTKRKGK